MVIKMTQQEEDLLNEMVADAEARSNDTPADLLTRIVGAAEELRQLQEKKAGYEDILVHVEKDMRRLSETVLPALMDEAGVPELRLADDVRLIRTEEVYASISKANAAMARSWLECHGYGSIVKDRVICEFDPGQHDEANKVRKALDKQGVAYELNSSVHAGTLKAFVREMLAAGNELPDCFSVHVQPVVVTKQSRTRSSKK